MGDELILLDTSILIDFFRKTDKRNSLLYSLAKEGYDFAVSAITTYEIYCGVNPMQLEYWESFLSKTSILPFDVNVSIVAASVNKELKKKNGLIETVDLLIASTAIANNIPLATLNKKHFERIEKLDLVN
jgi:tRNA(fMet)-specific endonuclease VapC